MAANNFQIEKAFFECLEKQCLTELNTIKKISEESLSYAIDETQSDAHPTPHLPVIEPSEGATEGHLNENLWGLCEPGTLTIQSPEPELGIEGVPNRSEAPNYEPETESDAPESPPSPEYEPLESTTKENRDRKLWDLDASGIYRIITAEPEDAFDDMLSLPEAPPGHVLKTESDAPPTPTSPSILPLEDLSQSNFEGNLWDYEEQGMLGITGAAEPEASIDNVAHGSEASERILLFKENGPRMSSASSTVASGHSDQINTDGSHENMSVTNKPEDLKITIHEIVIDVEEEDVGDIIEHNGVSGHHFDHHNSFG